jgi:hypothetical protein
MFMGTIMTEMQRQQIILLATEKAEADNLVDMLCMTNVYNMAVADRAVLDMEVAIASARASKAKQALDKFAKQLIDGTAPF